MTSRHQFVWNTASFLDATDENAFALFKNALQGLVSIPSQEETAALYCDAVTPLLQRRISHSKTVADFLDHLEAIGDQDLAMVLTEIDDKADAINSLSDENINELAESSYYFNVLGYTVSIDYLGLVANLDGILFSVASKNHWATHEVEIGCVFNQEAGGETGLILSVCNMETARRIFEILQPASEAVPLEQLLPDCVIAPELIEWIYKLDEENQKITRNKIILAQSREFKGGEPLFKTLSDADGMREIRFRAFPGGATRVLFGSLENGKIALLRGFIKKSNSEGYSENIPAAAKTWNALKTTNKRAADLRQLS